MITNFEKETDELQEWEYKLLPGIIKGLAKRTKINPITGEDICKKINDFYHLDEKQNFNPIRFRKLTNFIRCKGILPVIATSKGYYCSYDKDQINDQIKSLEQRASAILASAAGLKKFLENE